MNSKQWSVFSIPALIALIFALCLPADAGAAVHRKHKRGPSAAARKSSGRRARPVRVSRVSGSRRRHRGRAVVAATGAVSTGIVLGHNYSGPWTVPTYADSTAGDNVDGEDLVVRRAAVDALGPYNGTIVVDDPNTGRILTMVNQKLALGEGFQPCSTVKVSVALAALREKVVERTSTIQLTRRLHMGLTQALAKSNNYYFANLGLKLGYDRVARYAKLFGYGEKAGWNIAGEQPGSYPSGPPANGGVGMLTSFGEEIHQTPLQLAGLITAVANGGTLYYLQYPKTSQELQSFTPKVKRQLDIKDLIDDVKPGMQGAVEFGTARRAKQDEPIFGKTGTCSEGHTHLGWFGSFNDAGRNKLVVVVLLTGGRPSIGPMAAGVAGDVYRRLNQQNYFMKTATALPATFMAPEFATK
ncbi:MAG TPA: penicillin-binding protein [Solibacterales bacterium]|nr:penicillin-binding protein [Bryobacterales bacterium]